NQRGGADDQSSAVPSLLGPGHTAPLRFLVLASGRPTPCQTPCQLVQVGQPDISDQYSNMHPDPSKHRCDIKHIPSALLPHTRWRRCGHALEPRCHKSHRSCSGGQVSWLSTGETEGCHWLWRGPGERADFHSEAGCGGIADVLLTARAVYAGQ